MRKETDDTFLTLPTSPTCKLTTGIVMEMVRLVQNNASSILTDQSSGGTYINIESAEQIAWKNSLT